VCSRARFGFKLQREEAMPTYTSGLQIRVFLHRWGRLGSFYKFKPLDFKHQETDNLGDMSDKTLQKSKNPGLLKRVAPPF
jgi:hypothetical protein